MPSADDALQLVFELFHLLPLGVDLFQLQLFSGFGLLDRKLQQFGVSFELVEVGDAFRPFGLGVVIIRIGVVVILKPQVNLPLRDIPVSIDILILLRHDQVLPLQLATLLLPALQLLVDPPQLRVVLQPLQFSKHHLLVVFELRVFVVEFDEVEGGEVVIYGHLAVDGDELHCRIGTFE